MIRGQNLPAITQIADSDVLIVDSASGGTRKITYAQLCQAVKQTLGIREVIDSVNITEDGYLMGGKVIADELAKLNDDMVKWQDFTVPFSGHPSTLDISNIGTEYVIPVLILPGSGNWNINVSFQTASKQIVLEGEGLMEGYNYVVRTFYINRS